jgi:hypothetical protein
MWRVWGREEMPIGLWWENPRDENHFEEPYVDGKIILKWIFEQLDGGIDWIDLTQDRDRWRTVVNTLMYLRVP